MRVKGGLYNENWDWRPFFGHL